MRRASIGQCFPSIWIYVAILACWHLHVGRQAFVMGYRVPRGGGNGASGGLTGPSGELGPIRPLSGQDDAAAGDVLTPAANEPSCEELKAMWRFSKRQSRAAETTNEIPTYRDPFRYNVWEPFGEERSRSMGGMRLLGKYRRPVFGRVIHNAPIMRTADVLERNRAFEEVARLYGNNAAAAIAAAAHQPEPPRRRVSSFRIAGGDHLMYPPIPPQQGSFQHLKELIRTERVKELQEQRMAEEAAARAASIIQATDHQRHGNARYSYDSIGDNDDENKAPLFVQQPQVPQQLPGIVTFPDLLAPSASRVRGPGTSAGPEAFVEYARPRNMAEYGPYGATVHVGGPYHRRQPNFYEPSLYNDYDGVML